MLTRAYFDRQPVADFGSLIEKYPSDEFASRFRSTIPLLALVDSGAADLQELLRRCGFSADAALHFEYTVAPSLGRGKASHTDLMVIEDSSAMAMEAKWTEPPSQTVRDWLGAEPTRNRQDVLQGWLSLIEKRTERALQGDLGSISYQIIHRAASACACGERPQLAYLEFITVGSGRGSTFRSDDLDRLYSALGRPRLFPFHLIRIEIDLMHEFHRIDSVDPSLVSDAVKEGLLTQKLFRFERLKVETLQH